MYTQSRETRQELLVYLLDMKRLRALWDKVYITFWSRFLWFLLQRKVRKQLSKQTQVRMTFVDDSTKEKDSGVKPDDDRAK